MRSLILTALLLLAAVPAAAQPSASAGSWRTDVPCTAGRTPALVDAGAAVDARVPGCVRATCVALPDGRRVCSCTGDTTIVVRVEAEGRTLHEWPSRSGMAANPESLRALQGDLDGDGRAETIVAEVLTIGNGLGISYTGLRIFDGRDPMRAPVRVQVEDFDPAGSFVRAAGGGPCWLIATRWNQLLDLDRGWGMYFIGQWMQYRDGRLEHDLDRPVVARRLLESFADARLNTPGAPFAHLRHPNARARPDHEAQSLPPLQGQATGTVRAVRGDSLEVALASGQTARFVLGDVLGEDYQQTSTWLADKVSARPYPAGYAAADARWLEGARVDVFTYRGEAGTVNLLFVHPRTDP